MLVEQHQDGIVQLIGFRHLGRDQLVELFPGFAQRVGQDDPILEDVGAITQGVAADGGLVGQLRQRGAVTGERVLQLRAVLRLLLLQFEQQAVQLMAGIGVEITLPEAEGADRPALAQRSGDGRRYRSEQFGEHAHVALAVLAQAGLAGDQLDQHLRLPQQLARHGALGLQRLLGLCGAQGVFQLIEMALELGGPRGVVADGGQQLQPRGQFSLGLAQPAQQRLVIAGLSDDDLDLDQVRPVLHVTSHLQCGAQQLQALQLGAGADELAIRVTRQIEVGQQHGNEEQHADEAELHGEAQAIHERDRGIQEALHRTSPNSYWYCMQHRGCSRARQSVMPVELYDIRRVTFVT